MGHTDAKLALSLYAKAIPEEEREASRVHRRKP
jgi:hypothetical protein